MDKQTEKSEKKIPKRILSLLINSISAGVVPRIGAPYIAIGRNDEIAALLSDAELVADGGSSMRFIIGRYGSGKSFLIQLIRGFALEKGFICADADLSPERRICGGKGGGVATYRELIRNLSSKASPEGGALAQIISKWLSSLQSEVALSGISPDSPEFERETELRVFSLSKELEEDVGGFDFAKVIGIYYRAVKDGDEDKKSSCLRWLRGEFPTKTEARQLLGVSSIIDDESWYNYIKLFARFVRMIGYKGLLIFIDECVNLYKITNRVARESNYEKLLSMFNDTLQGKAPGLGIIIGGTPQFLEDQRRGLYSYDALKSRLSDSKYSSAEYKNLLGPVIKLRRLSDNELYALILRLTKLHAQNYNWTPRVTEEDMTAFLQDATRRAGADTMMTPREMIRDYLSVLNLLYQNENATFSELVAAVKPTYDEGEGDPAGESEERQREIELDEFEI